MLFDSICDSTKSVIDIGCGNGSFTKNMANKFNAIFSIDINTIRVKNLKKYIVDNNIDNVTVIEMSAYNIEKENESFDIAVFYRSIDHIADYYCSLKEAYRVLKKNGVVYINLLDTRITNTKIENMDKLRKFADVLYDELKIGEGVCEIKYVDIDKLKQQIENIGFRNILEEKHETQTVNEYFHKIDADIKESLSKLKVVLSDRYIEYNRKYDNLLNEINKTGIEFRPTIELVCNK
jgi:ubiquinone/menaquinone biosynthesis C-methylase UbiE